MLDPGTSLGVDNDHIGFGELDRGTGRLIALLAPPLVAAGAVAFAEAIEASRNERVGRGRAGPGLRSRCRLDRRRQDGRRSQKQAMACRRVLVNSHSLGGGAAAGATA